MGRKARFIGVLLPLTSYCLLMLPELNQPVRVDYSIISSSVHFIGRVMPALFLLAIQKPSFAYISMSMTSVLASDCIFSLFFKLSLIALPFKNVVFLWSKVSQELFLLFKHAVNLYLSIRCLSMTQKTLLWPSIQVCATGFDLHWLKLAKHIWKEPKKWNLFDCHLMTAFYC